VGEPEVKPTEAITFNLLKGFKDKGHVVAFDSFYTGIPLVTRLAAHRIYVIATVRSNRKWLAKGMTEKDYPKQPRGFLVTKKGSVDRDLPGGARKTITVWQQGWLDTKWVNFIATVQPKRATVRRTIFTRASPSAPKVWEKKDVDAPSTALMYNGSMGGCDLGDQLMSYNLRHTSNDRPYVILLLHLFLVSVLNARVLYNKSHDVQVPVTKWYTTIKRQLLAEAARMEKHAGDNEDNDSEESEEEKTPTTNRHTLRNHATFGQWKRMPAEHRTQGKHTPVRAAPAIRKKRGGPPPTKDIRGRCIVCVPSLRGRGHTANVPSTENKREKQLREASLRRKAGYDNLQMGQGDSACNKKIDSKCSECRVWLHVAREGGTVGRSCWEIWHSEPDLSKVRV
jgi:hypothetical protein